MVIYIQHVTRVVDRAVANAGTVFINWRSITHMINSQPKFAELDPPIVLEVKFLAKKIPAKSRCSLSVSNDGISAAERGNLFALGLFIRATRPARGDL